MTPAAGREAGEQLSVCCVSWSRCVGLAWSGAVKQPGRGEMGCRVRAWLGGAMAVMELCLCAGCQVFVYFKSSNLILCSQIHCGGGHQGCFAKGLFFHFSVGTIVCSL